MKITKEDFPKIRHYLSVFAIAFVFLAFGIWEMADPQYWISFVPKFASQLVNASTLDTLHGAVLAIIGVWLVSGWKQRIAAVFSSLIMLEIIIGLINLSGFSDLFVRDAALLLVSVSLFFDDYKEKKG